jgi:hypothetical protein
MTIIRMAFSKMTLSIRAVIYELNATTYLLLLSAIRHFVILLIVMVPRRKLIIGNNWKTENYKKI